MNHMNYIRSFMHKYNSFTFLYKQRKHFCLIEWLTPVQATWGQSLVKSVNFWEFYFVKFISLWKTRMLTIQWGSRFLPESPYAWDKQQCFSIQKTRCIKSMMHKSCQGIVKLLMAVLCRRNILDYRSNDPETFKTFYLFHLLNSLM